MQFRRADIQTYEDYLETMKQRQSNGKMPILEGWKIDKPRQGRLVRVRFMEPDQSIAVENTGRWWGMEGGWQITNGTGEPRYLTAITVVGWLPIASDGELKRLRKLFWVGLWVDFRNIFRDARKARAEIRKERKG